jgi:hypothetical protein
MVQVRSPMLFAVGMYLPLETTFAIFVGGLVRGLVDKRAAKRGYNDAQRARVENAGMLSASGLIAGEALMGLFIATVVFIRDRVQHKPEFWTMPGLEGIASWLAIPVLAVLVMYLVSVPLSKAGRADEPAPPAAIM